MRGTELPRCLCLALSSSAAAQLSAALGEVTRFGLPESQSLQSEIERTRPDGKKERKGKRGRAEPPPQPSDRSAPPPRPGRAAVPRRPRRCGGGRGAGRARSGNSPRVERRAGGEAGLRPFV